MATCHSQVTDEKLKHREVRYVADFTQVVSTEVGIGGSSFCLLLYYAVRKAFGTQDGRCLLEAPNTSELSM